MENTCLLPQWRSGAHQTDSGFKQNPRFFSEQQQNDPQRIWGNRRVSGNFSVEAEPRTDVRIVCFWWSPSWTLAEGSGLQAGDILMLSRQLYPEAAASVGEGSPRVLLLSGVSVNPWPTVLSMGVSKSPSWNPWFDQLRVSFTGRVGSWGRGLRSREGVFPLAGVSLSDQL